MLIITVSGISLVFWKTCAKKQVQFPLTEGAILNFYFSFADILYKHKLFGEGLIMNKDEIESFIYTIENDKEEAAHFLEREDWNFQDPNGVTPLHIAAKAGNLRLLSTMLKKERIDIHQTDKKGRTPLYYALKNGKEDIVNYLIDNCENIGHDPKFFNLCAKRNRRDLQSKLASKIKFQRNNRLIEAYKKLEKDASRLFLAVHQNDLNDVERILQEGVNPNQFDQSGESLWGKAFREGKHDIVKLLIDDLILGDEYNLKEPDGTTLLHVATTYSKLSLLEKLIADKKLDLNQKDFGGNTPLKIAIKNKDLKSVEILLESGAKLSDDLPNLDHEILDVIQKHDNKMKKSLMIESYNKLEKDAAQLFIAVEENNYEVVKRLLDEGVNPNQRDRNGMSLLWKAYYEDKNDILYLLLNHERCDPNQTEMPNSSSNETLAYRSVLYKKSTDRELFYVLMANPKISVNGLLNASINAHNFESVSFLLERKDIDVNSDYSSSFTCSPLMQAIIYDYRDSMKSIIALLLNHHEIKIENQNDPMRPPLLLALQRQDNELIHMLKEKMTPTAISFAEEIYNNEIKHNLALRYQESVDAMSKMIILGNDDINTEFRDKEDVKVSVISNLEGYGNRASLPSKQVIYGNKIVFNHQGKEYPIGYAVHFPEDHEIQLKYVVIEVYGGRTRKSLTEIDSFRIISKPLLKTGNCAVISLFLPDYLQDKGQFAMSEELHGCIHAGIDYFYHTLAGSPETIHPELAGRNIENAKFFLYGASFGGRTAIRHSQLYSGFSGYISHDGGIANLNDIDIIKNKRSHLNEQLIVPINHVENINSNLLILQNVDDNNTNIDVALEFYKELIKYNKAHLARLAFFKKGSPLEDGWHKKGHGITSDRALYWETILDFMEQGPSAIPELHYIKFLIQDRYSNQFFRNLPEEKRFLALAHKQYKVNRHKTPIDRNDESLEEWQNLWDKNYKPLLRALKEVNTMVADKDYRRKQLEHLKQNGFLTDEVIQRALKSQFKILKEFFKEELKIEIESEDYITNNLDLINIFRELLFRESSLNTLAAFLLENLYFNNLDLLPEFSESKAWKGEDELQNMSNDCKKEFELSIAEFRRANAKTWLKAAKRFKEIPPPDGEKKSPKPY